MADSTTPALIAFALGAIASSIPKVWEYFFENKKHRQSIEKLYFERKLNVLQAYVATLTQLSANFFHNEVSITLTKELDFFKNSDEFKDLVMNNLTIHIAKSMTLVEKLSELSSASAMYIDLEYDPNTTYDLAKSIHIDISTLGEKLQEVFDVQNQFNLSKDPAVGEIGFDEYSEKKKLFTEHIQKIADNYNKYKKHLNDTIKAARKDIKAFKV